MACHHVIIFCALMIIWHILLASTQDPLPLKDRYLVPQRTRDLLRTRKMSQRAFKNMDLLVARSFGKRAGSECYGGMCLRGFPEFAGARGYGKRSIDVNQLKCLFVECDREEVDNTIRSIDYPNNGYEQFKRDQEIVLPD
ncbi:uncharacterized protein LOC130903785 [Diorhabda carinulata]|uniref:uncharacterized protein LOC130903785 n=1 Tax=Diorhabda carinulata TaxID=1163345 RepID=UPI0025A1A8A5|nr:uncharacterized protein LOC130903785 [Diorhabda carinulata]